LNPKDHKQFVEGIAEEVGISNEVVRSFIVFYYNELRKNLSELIFPRVYVNGLGTFRLRKGKLEKSIKRHRDILGNLDKRQYRGYEKHVGVKEKLVKLEEALKVVTKMQDDKREFRDRKG
jgi:nucleoid DNA-binding protein